MGDPDFALGSPLDLPAGLVGMRGGWLVRIPEDALQAPFQFQPGFMANVPAVPTEDIHPEPLRTVASGSSQAAPRFTQ